jgi:hypothetical protein
MRRSLVLMLLSILAGSLFGLGMSSIPSPHDVAIFWGGNFCAPWLVLAFLAGRAQRSWRLSALAGVAAGLVYGVFGFLGHRSRPLVAGLALALPFFVEPVLWPIRNGHYQGPSGLWAVEVSVGFLFVSSVLTFRRRSMLL